MDKKPARRKRVSAKPPTVRDAAEILNEQLIETQRRLAIRENLLRHAQMQTEDFQKSCARLRDEIREIEIGIGVLRGTIDRATVVGD